MRWFTDWVNYLSVLLIACWVLAAAVIALNVIYEMTGWRIDARTREGIGPMATEGGPAPRKTGRAGVRPAPRPATPGKPGLDGSVEFGNPVTCQCKTCGDSCWCPTGHVSGVCACCRADRHDGSCGGGIQAVLEPSQ